MSNKDPELEKLMAARLAEMQKNILVKKTKEDLKDTQQKKGDGQTTKSPRDILVQFLGFRGLEVLENAEMQFPTQTRLLVDKIAELCSAGEIPKTIDGGQLLSLFRTIGLPIRMTTKIKVEEDGKMVSLGDKIKGSRKA